MKAISHINRRKDITYSIREVSLRNTHSAPCSLSEKGKLSTRKERWPLSMKEEGKGSLCFLY